MKTTVTLPAAFSVRDANEFFPMRHVMARLNSKVTVTEVATGRHVNGGEIVLWGIIQKEGQPLTKCEVEDALREAGFDFAHDASIRPSNLLAADQEEATQCRATPVANSGSAVVGGRKSTRKTADGQEQQGVSSKG